MMGSGQKYLQYLPAVFQGEIKDANVPFTVRYLKIFEKIISSVDDGELDGRKGIVELLDIIADLFHPRFSFLFETEEKRFLPPLTSGTRALLARYFGYDVDVDEFLDEFLKWLAGWTALVLKDDWDLSKKREIIARIIPLYRMRGTKRGLEEYLKIYVGKQITIIDNVEPFKVGVSSRVGGKARIGGLRPYFFIVEVDVMYMFSWDDVPGTDQERLTHYLRDEFGLDWAEGADVHKSGERRTITIVRGDSSAEIVMDEDREKAVLIVGGETTHLSVQKKEKKTVIYNARSIRASDIRKWRDKKRAIDEIINAEKPAHAEYWLNIQHPGLTLGVHSRVGESTLL